MEESYVGSWDAAESVRLLEGFDMTIGLLVVEEG